MNTKTLNRGKSDPRTEMVHRDYLRLAADLMVTADQDLIYWNTVPVPLRPSNRVAFEELRQLAVFSPLVLVALAFIKFNFIGAALAFLVALPLMNMLHKALARAIYAKGVQARNRDGGRYAFTKFMCSEFGLRPEDVTMKLVLKMCDDFKLWLAAANRVLAADRAAARTVRPAAYGAKAPARGYHNTRAAAVTAAAATAGVAALAEGVSDLAINPATGLPMMDVMVDIQGNTYGLSNIDDAFNDAHLMQAVDATFTGGGADFAPGFNGMDHNL